MSLDSSGMASPSLEGSPAADESRLPGNWIEAIPSLIASRLGIFRIEAQDALGVTVRKLIILAVLAFCLIASCGLLTAGLIGLISVHFNCAWYFVAFSLGGIYLLIALVMLLIFKGSKKIESFPVTRKEFEKDHEWLNQLKNRSSSQN
jgi:uncharacterized membrane protein YqjE